MSVNPEAVYQRLVKAGEEWAQAEADATRSEEMKAHLLATLKLKFDGSDANRETHAKATQAYKGHIEEMVQHRLTANILRAKYKAAECWFEAWRSVESTRRQEMKLG